MLDYTKPESDMSACQPEAGSCYGYAWKIMGRYFLELLLVSFLAFLFYMPSAGFSIAEEIGGYDSFSLALFSLVYMVLLLWPIEYGVSYAFLKAVRKDNFQVKDMFDVFQTYLNAILGQLLVSIIVTAGFVFFIIPGIIFACKLAFVPYLVVDRKLDAVEAVKTSWNMTRGHAGTVFLIGMISLFIAVAGLICFIIGIIPAMIWINLAYASLYCSVSETYFKDAETVTMA